MKRAHLCAVFYSWNALKMSKIVSFVCKPLILASSCALLGST